MSIKDAFQMGINGFIQGLVRTGAGTDGPGMLPATPGLGPIDVIDTTKPPTQDNVPGSWSRHWLGPGQPFSPIEGSARDKDAEQEPRSFQYITGVNATISPRIAYGLLAFTELRKYAENVPDVAQCIRLITEELKAFVPTITDLNDQAIDANEEPELQWMVERPDRFNPWPVWLSRFLYNVLVYDAGTTYMMRDDNEKIVGTRVIDGSTIFVLVDTAGESPRPPAPAFTQVIWGVPKMYLNTSQLWYKPRHLRADAPYGRSPIEDSLQAVKLLASLWDYEFEKYQVGNIPEVIVAVPGDWGQSPEQILEYEAAHNSRFSGSNKERVRMHFMPAGTEVIQTKDITFNRDSYDVAANTVRMSYGIVQSEVGDAPSGGLGGSGYQEAMTSSFYRQCLAPVISYIEGHFNDILKMNGQVNRRFKLKFPPETLDPSKEETKWKDRFVSGIAKRDEARVGVNMQKIGGEDGEFILTPGKGQGEEEGAGAGGLAGMLGGTANGGDDGNLTGKQIDVANQNEQIPVVGGSNGHGKMIAVKAVMATTLQKIDGKPNTGVMVALPIPEAQEAQGAISWPQGAEQTPPEELHLTLAFLGEAVGLDTGSERLFATANKFAQEHAPITGKLNGMGIFREVEDGERDCIWLHFDAPALPAFRQELITFLAQNEFPADMAHGFTAHITLGYVPAGQAITLPDLPVTDITAGSLRVAWADQTQDYPFTAGEPPEDLGKVYGYDLQKHCGLCPEDDQYFGAVVTMRTEVEMPHQGANESYIVSIGGGHDLPPRPAVWKPKSGEKQSLIEWVGGDLYRRAEAAYLVDRELAPDEERYLVPVTYIDNLNGEPGSVQHYVRERGAREPVEHYGARWIMQAAVFDYVIGQVDRLKNNWLTHPDEERRPVFIDNDLSFPVKADQSLHSAWVNAMAGERISDEMLESLFLLVGNQSLWSDIQEALGDQEATDNARDRAKKLLEEKRFPSGEIKVIDEVEVVNAESNPSGSDGTDRTGGGTEPPPGESGVRGSETSPSK